MLLGVVLSIGCGAVSEETVDEQSQAAVTYYAAWNGATGFPNSNTILTNLCHPTLISGSGAASQSVILPGNVPECGGSVSVGSTAVSAGPNSCFNPPSGRQGTMSMTVRCQPLSDFGPVTSGSTEYTNMWNGTGSLEHVSNGQQMLALAPTFNTANACYLSGLGSMSVGNEYAWISYDSTYAWLNADGYKGLSDSARCSRLGRAGGAVQTVHAWPGTPGTGISVASGVCLITQVNGSIDNGGVLLSQSGGVWGLSISGDVGYARAECYTYN